MTGYLDEKTREHKYGPICIEKNVWLACNVVVSHDVNIGEGCIVGAGSVVTRSLPSYWFCAGSPAKPIRKLERK